MTSETVEALHAVTSELKACNDERDAWIKDYDKRNGDEVAEHGVSALSITRSEAEIIFTRRREAIEARLRELGWERRVRIGDTGSGGRGGGSSGASGGIIDFTVQPNNGDAK